LTLQVHKRDGQWEDFEQEKLVKGMAAACRHTNVSRDQVIASAAHITGDLMQRQLQQIEAMELGEIVMKELQNLDRVAYVRFACVYRRFKELDEVMEAIRSVSDEEQEKIEVSNG